MPEPDDSTPSRFEVERRRNFLGEHSAFADLSPAILRLLAERMTRAEFGTGEAILEQGGPGDSLLVLTEGRAEARMLHADGSHHVLGTVYMGSVIGEMALITGEPRTATVVAIQPVEALVLPARSFRTLVSQHPEIAVLLTNVVAQRLGQTDVDGLGGKAIDKFRIQRRCGRGGMAIVYQAAPLGGGEEVALKMLSHRLVYDRVAMERFEAEADMVESIEHPGIARSLGRFDAFGTCFIVMEFCDGPSLDVLIEQSHPLPEEAIRAVFGSVAGALAHVHSLGIVHGDIKPANVLLTADGRVKLTDFGIATALHASTIQADSPTRPIVGTPWYMAPEQFRREPPNPRSDIYSLGCVLYEMFAGTRPVESTSVSQLIAGKFTYELPRRDLIGAGMPTDLHDLLTRLLDPKPEKRDVDLAALGTDTRVDPELVAAALRARARTAK